ncbi:MAG: hypothetical protein Q9209_001237 [Squamulea sp. 1 TL-2023]
MPSKVPVGLLNLPFDIQTEILSYLLPSQRLISYDTHGHILRRYRDSLMEWSNLDWSNSEWSNFTYGIISPYPDILLANRFLYSSGISYLYLRKTFKMSVSPTGYEFLYLTDSPLPELPPLPYSRMKEFILEIHGRDMSTTASRLRSNLVHLVRLFRQNNVHFRRLRIEFPEFPNPMPVWEDAWDNIEPKDGDLQPEIFEVVGMSPTDIVYYTHNEIFAQRTGASSTFAWVLCVFALCPSLADECIVELPKSLKDKPHMQACAKWYAEGLDGRALFLEAEECCLKHDIYLINHEYGYSEECDCEVCTETHKEHFRNNMHKKLQEQWWWLEQVWEDFQRDVYTYPRCVFKASMTGVGEDIDTYNCEGCEIAYDVVVRCKCEQCTEVILEKLRTEEQKYATRKDDVPLYLEQWQEKWTQKREELECRSQHTTLLDMWKALWRGVRNYPSDFWWTWRREEDGFTASRECPCLECQYGWPPIVKDGSSRLAFSTKLYLIGTVIADKIWRKDQDSEELEE